VISIQYLTRATRNNVQRCSDIAEIQRVTRHGKVAVAMKWSKMRVFRHGSRSIADRCGGSIAVLLQSAQATNDAAVVPHIVDGSLVLHSLLAPWFLFFGDPVAIPFLLLEEKVGVVDAGTVPAGGLTCFEHPPVSLLTALLYFIGFLGNIPLTRVVLVLELERTVVHAGEGISGGRPEEESGYRLEKRKFHPRLLPKTNTRIVNIDRTIFLF